MSNSFIKKVIVSDLQFQIEYKDSEPTFENNFKESQEILKLGLDDDLMEISFEELKQFLKGIYSEKPRAFDFIR